MNVEGIHKRLEVGFTWYRPDTWAGAVNPSCKHLLFSHAFDRLGAIRLELKCDARNMRSRAAIAKLGAKQEGIFRHHMIMWDGFLRDSVYFSIIREEWPAVRDGLARRLETFRT
jgi:RimJ/RimL family protein N-acetyltransferase